MTGALLENKLAVQLEKRMVEKKVAWSENVKVAQRAERWDPQMVLKKVDSSVDLTVPSMAELKVERLVNYLAGYWAGHWVAKMAGQLDYL